MNRVIAVLAFCCGLSIGYPVHAAVITLAKNVTATQTVPSLPFQNNSNAGGAPLIGNQAYQVVTTGSCTAQIVGSIDGVNWINYGTAIIQAAPGTAGAVGSVPYAWLGAIVTAVTGSCTVLMSE